ncbi:MAG TPA: hypothetical protein VHY56_12615 [Candidatus Binataceae bacterium]|jgi:hypothetical protein|nr:hypothetical protein [Candidatus Binataceae bacterium]
MAELGIRGNVMGPQPIAQRQPLPPAMLEAAEQVIAMFERGDAEGLAAISSPAVASEVRSLAMALAPGRYSHHEIIAAARVIHHYYLKVRMFGAGLEPFSIQFRLGHKDGKWLLWEIINLSGRRAAWTR